MWLDFVFFGRSTDYYGLSVFYVSVVVVVAVDDLYVNIPIHEAINLLKIKLLGNNGTQITHQIIALLKVALSQNYFTFQQKIYQPEQGIAMGSPISGLVAEIFLQHYEDIHTKQLLDTKNIAFYTRYVDDILIIYDKKIQPQTINNHILTLRLRPLYIYHASFNARKPNVIYIYHVDIYIILATLSARFSIFCGMSQH
jgi:hypothetical protein